LPLSLLLCPAHNFIKDRLVKSSVPEGSL